MDDIPEARQIPDATLEAMVHQTDPSWELRAATPVERGFCTVYRVEIDGDDAPAECYLKASPDGQTWSIPTEARIQAVLAGQTSIPVPAVIGVTDAHETLPTPFYLMQARPGKALDYERIGRLGDDVLRRLGRETGEYLGELHAVPAVSDFGPVRHDGSELNGTRPNGDPETLAVVEPREDWPAYVREYAERELERHADSRFSDLTPELSRWIDAGIDGLEEPFEPVLGRNDHGLHNLLVDPETGEITAMLDWGYTLAVPAAFDFEFAAYLYSGAFLAGLPGVSDRRSRVREAMLTGYRTAAPELVDRVETPEPLYELLAMVRIMNDFRSLDLPDEREQAVMGRIRTHAQTVIEG